MDSSHSTADLRRAARIVLPIPLCVEARENENTKWKEVTNLVSVSSIGAGFYLNRRLQIGQIVFISLPLPPQLRLFDQTAAQYNVWAVVRHCRSVPALNSSVYHVGAAFIGKYPPAGYKKNPLALYEISGVKADGFWEITEAGMNLSRRKDPRFSVPIEVFIHRLDNHQNIIDSERTVTENISVRGAAVFSSLEIAAGGQVRISSDFYNFSSLAIVRARRIGSDHLPRLHLEFVESHFPLDGID